MIIELENKRGKEREVEIQRLIDKHNLEIFSLDKGPLIRIGLLVLNPAEHVLIITMHHIISDGWSFNLFLKELNHRYLALSMNQATGYLEPNIQYSDFAEWQAQRMQGKVLEAHLKYARNLLESQRPTLELPSDYLRPAKPSFKGRRESFSVSEELVGHLRQFGREHDCTLFMILLAAYAVLLKTYTGQEDFLIGAPVSGRKQERNRGIDGLLGEYAGPADQSCGQSDDARTHGPYQNHDD